MAERRMFSRQVVNCDRFIEMPLSAQALYFHLGLQADDDGFLDSPKMIQRSIGAAEDDLKLLEAKGFIIRFESGVIVITHWKQNNSIKGDRHKKTLHLDEYAQVKTLPNRAYCLAAEVLEVEALPAPKTKAKKPAATRHKHGTYGNVLLSDEQLEKLKSEHPNDWQRWIERVDDYCQSSGKSYKDYLATIRSWARRDAEKNPKNENVVSYEGAF